MILPILSLSRSSEEEVVYLVCHYLEPCTYLSSILSIKWLFILIVT